MAATVDDIKNKINLLSKSTKIIKAPRGYVSKIYNWEPFSVRKTVTTLEKIFYKLLNHHGTVHNKKYLQSFFPYYVFYDSILDLDGKIVLLIRRETVSAYLTRYVFHVTREFYSKYKDQVDYVHQMYGGSNPTTSDYYVRLEVEDIDDIYFLFHKQYTFNGFTEIKTFKQKLIAEFNKELLLRKSRYLYPEAC